MFQVPRSTRKRLHDPNIEGNLLLSWIRLQIRIMRFELSSGNMQIKAIKQQNIKNSLIKQQEINRWPCLTERSATIRKHENGKQRQLRQIIRRRSYRCQQRLHLKSRTTKKRRL